MTQAGGRYVEAAVMTPFAPKRIASPMLLGGPHAEEFLQRATPLGFVGQTRCRKRSASASATKMCRSVMIKGIEALLIGIHAGRAPLWRGKGRAGLACRTCCRSAIGRSWRVYMISRSLEHGTRRAEEMREVAKTVAEAGIEPLMSGAAAERQDWAAAHKSALSRETLAALLDAVLQDVAAEGTGTRKRA